jgi:hypothetical protein
MLMKNFLIVFLVFLLVQPKPAKAEFSTAFVGIGIMIGLVVGDYFHQQNDDKKAEKEAKN